MEDFLSFIQRWLSIPFSRDVLWRIAACLAIVIIGIWLSRWLARVLDRVMIRFSVEGILRNFLRNMAYAVALVIVFIAALDFAGVPTTSMLAVLGAAGLGIGLALKDSLSNIASGVMLIVLRPFHSGDTVQVAGVEGVVECVRIFHTQMITSDNRAITLPNSQITSAPIINFTGRGTRRVDIPLEMAYEDNLEQLRSALVAIASAHPRVEPKPAPELAVITLGARSVNLMLRAWVRSEDYGQIQASLLESILSDALARMRPLPTTRSEVQLLSAATNPALPAVP